MTEKNKFENEAKKERFEFILAINDNIICQRYFRINGFNERAVNSVEFTEVFKNCVKLIKEDLQAKSRMYLWNTAPQVLDTEDDIKAKASKLKLKVPSFILCRDTEKVYIWNGEDVEPYNEYFNKADYIGNDSESGVYTLKFTFKDNGREVMSEIWDGSQYPRFVRTNIDLSNSRNRYKAENNFMPFESILVDIFNKSQVDLIPIIVRDICSVCSYADRKKYTYLDEKNSVVSSSYKSRYIREWENACKVKTAKYFKNLGV